MAVRVCFSAFLRRCCLCSSRRNVSLVLTICATKAVFLLHAEVILIYHGEFMTKTGSERLSGSALRERDSNDVVDSKFVLNYME